MGGEHNHLGARELGVLPPQKAKRLRGQLQFLHINVEKVPATEEPEAVPDQKASAHPERNSQLPVSHGGLQPREDDAEPETEHLQPTRQLAGQHNAFVLDLELLEKSKQYPVYDDGHADLAEALGQCVTRE